MKYNTVLQGPGHATSTFCFSTQIKDSKCNVVTHKPCTESCHACCVVVCDRELQYLASVLGFILVDEVHHKESVSRSRGSIQTLSEILQHAAQS